MLNGVGLCCVHTTTLPSLVSTNIFLQIAFQNTFSPTGTPSPICDDDFRGYSNSFTEFRGIFRFSAFMAGATRPPAARRRAPARVLLQACPVCGRLRPSTEMATHVNACLDAGNWPSSGAQTTTTTTTTLDAPGRDSASAVPSHAPEVSLTQNVNVNKKRAREEKDKDKEEEEEVDNDDSHEPAKRVAAPTTSSFLAAWNAPRLAGHFVLENVITEATELELLRFLGDPTKGSSSKQCEPMWRLRHFNGTAYGKSWGIQTNLAGRTQSPPSVRIPSALRCVVDAVRERASHVPHIGSTWEPTEANAIAYVPRLGHSLEPHADDRNLSGPAIATLSLGADAIMTFTEEKGTRRVRVPLPRRSIAIQTGPSRYAWLHSIQNGDLQGELRVSLTFRRGKFEMERRDCWE